MGQLPEELKRSIPMPRLATEAVTRVISNRVVAEPRSVASVPRDVHMPAWV